MVSSKFPIMGNCSSRSTKQSLVGKYRRLGFYWVYLASKFNIGSIVGEITVFNHFIASEHYFSDKGVQI